MQRRNFLQTTAAGTLPFLLNGMPLRAMADSPLFSSVNPDSDKVLVLIQLIGGNDGLNTIIPLDQYAGLAAVRGNIMIPEQYVQPLTDTVGVHPGLSFLRTQFEAGQAGVIQSVGYPNQNRSHFRSMDIWNSGSGAENTWSTGWLGRYLDSYFDGYPEGYPNADYPHPFAITLGYNVSETCQGWASNYSLTVFDPFAINPLLEGEEGTLPDTPYGDELAFLRNAIQQTNEYGEVITQAANLGTNTVPYHGENRLARQLKNVALLLSGGLRTKVFVVSLGGFDTHADQVLDGSPLGGEHAILLKTISEAMASFQKDLFNLGLEERVLSMTFSEFGRRIRSNAGLGTDHGTAAPIMLFGSCVNPQVLGDNPEIDNQIGQSEGVPMQYDFRDVYGSILQDWFEVEEAQVRSLLYEDYTHLPILSNCTELEEETPDELTTVPLDIVATPNPCRDGFTLTFECARAEVRIDLFDGTGKVVRPIAARTLPPGRHRIRVDMSRYAPGPYAVRVRVGGEVQTKRVVKIR